MSEIIIESQKFKNNLDIISKHIKDKSKLALVMKDNAYGHGIEQIAPLACAYGIKSVFVKNEPEAQRIADFFEYITVFYGKLSPQTPKNIALSISSLETLESLEQNRLIELEINTGMNRNGIPRDKISFFIEKILKKKLSLLGVFSHNGYGDWLENSFEEAQKNFIEVKEEITYLAQKLGFALPRFHSLSSSGTLRSSDLNDDIYRIGIAAYGYLGNTFELPIAQSLKPIASLWAEKICSQHLLKGSKIGYGGKSILEKDSVVSTYDVGYGDGFFRLNANKDKLTTAEGYAILPVTSMDCFSCICEEEKVCVFNDATTIAKVFDTIPYEVLTSLSPFIKRIVI